MEETPKERSARIRRSLIHLPRALFADVNGRSSFFARIVRGRGLKIGAALAGAAGVAALVSSYKKKREDEAKPGEETPDFNADQLPIPEKSVVEPGVASAKVPDIEPLPPKKSEASQPIEKPLTDDGWMSKIKKFFKKEEDSQPPKPGLSAGRVFASKLGKNLGGEYRTKFEFTGFSSAKSLAKFGAYTTDEANKIVQLKSSGVNTSANAGKMSADTEERIRFYAKKHGLSEDVALKMAQMESGGNPNAISATGAIGVYQFTGRTASEMGIKDRFDQDQNIEAGVLMAKKSVKKLTESDLPVTATNIYLMHQLGVSGARELIIAASKDKAISTLSKTTQNAIKHNFGASTSRSAKEYIRRTEAALDERSTSDRFASATETAPAVAAIQPNGSAAVIAPVAIPPVVLAPTKTQAKPVPVKIAQIDDPTLSVEESPTSVKQASRAAPSAPATQVKQMPQALVCNKNGSIIAVS